MRSRKNLLVALLLGISALGGLFAVRGYVRTGELWGFQAAMPPFMDIRVITDGAVAYRQGVDPMQSNPTDSSGRPLNYPRVWQSLYRLGIGPGDAVWLGGLCAGLFVVGILVVPPALTAAEAGWMLAALFSPAVVLGLERGNTDLGIFFLVALAVVTVARGTAWPLVLLLGAFVLKLFPLAGLVVLVRRGRAALQWTAVVAAGFALLYLAFSYDDLLTIRANTPSGAWMSYGLDVLSIKAGPANAALGRALYLGSRGLVLVTLAVAAWAAFRRREAWIAAEGRALDSFRVGAACYAGTFLLGSNFLYRLVFLLFVIPQLLGWARGPANGPRGTAQAALAGCYVSLWSLLLDRALHAWPAVSFGLTVAAHWLLFCTLVILLFRTLPAWLRAAGGRVAGDEIPSGGPAG